MKTGQSLKKHFKTTEFRTENFIQKEVLLNINTGQNERVNQWIKESEILVKNCDKGRGQIRTSKNQSSQILGANYVGASQRLTQGSEK